MDLNFTEITLSRAKILQVQNLLFRMEHSEKNQPKVEYGTAQISGDMLYYYDPKNDEWEVWESYENNIRDDYLTFYTIEE